MFLLDIAIRGGTLGLAILGIIVGILALIFFVKRRLHQQSESDLAATFASHEHRSPLEGRNKYPEVDAFKLSGTFFNLGLAISLGVIVLAFGWTQYEKQIDVSDLLGDLEIDMEQEIVRTAEPPPPPPPPPPPVIEEVPDELVLEDETQDFVDQSIDDETDFERPEPVADAPPPPPPPPPPPKEEEIFKVVEQMPRFPGCEDIAGTQAEKKTCADTKLLQFIQGNIKYPAIARENGIQGRCFITFVVEKDGSVTDVRLVRDIGGQCGQESLRVVNLMSKKGIKWIPGKQRGRSVRVQFNLPVHFRLE